MNFLRQSCREFLFTLSSTGHSHIREWTHSILDPPSDGGLVLIRELEERLGLDRLIDEQVRDARQSENKKFPLADLLLQSVYIRLAGYEDLNNTAQVSTDPGFRLLGYKRNWDFSGALTFSSDRALLPPLASFDQPLAYF